MRLRNDSIGYGLVTIAFHWITVAALVAQVVVGYLIDDSGHGRGRGRGEGSGHGRGRGGDVDLDDPLVRAHLVLGVMIVTVTLLRWVWRRTTPLPAWSTRLPPGARRAQHVTELGLYALLVVTPITGALVLFGDDDLVPLHVACHIALYLVVAVHLVVVLRWRTAGRMLSLRTW